MKNLEAFLSGVGAVAMVAFFFWAITPEKTDPSPTHFILCPEMDKAAGVYGEVKAEGGYLRVYLTKDATSALLIGPDCLIVPDVREKK